VGPFDLDNLSVGESQVLTREFPSPVLRDAFHMQSLADKSLTDAQTTGLDKPSSKFLPDIHGSLGAAIWFFAALEGLELSLLTDTHLNHWSMVTYLTEYMSSELPWIPCPKYLSEALELGDFYDISLFPRLMTEMLWKLARIGKFFALSSFTIAVQLRDLDLAKFAVKRMEGLPRPSLFPKGTAEAMGAGPWWCLVAAYERAIIGNSSHHPAYRSYQADERTGSAAEWRTMAEAFRFE
jgi:hypothetical protein